MREFLGELILKDAKAGDFKPLLPPGETLRLLTGHNDLVSSFQTRFFDETNRHHGTLKVYDKVLDIFSREFYNPVSSRM